LRELVDDDDAPVGRGVWRSSIVRVTAITGVVALVIAVAAGVWAASWSEVESSPVPGLQLPADESEPATPSPTPGASSPPAVEPDAPEAPAPDTSAPAAPIVGAPSDGFASADPFPVFSGTGAPGAEVYIQLVDPSSGMARTIAAALVAADGTWSARSAQRIADGRHELLVMQVDAVGNISAAVHRVIVIDTVALPPTIDALPSGPLRLLPELTGTGEPHALVTVRDDTGATIGAAVVRGDGVWRLALPDPGRDGATLAATQADAAGNISHPSSPTAPLVFARASIAVDEIASSGDGTWVVTFAVDGLPGAVVEVAVDGESTGQLLTLGDDPVFATTPPLADGDHTIAVRYREGARVGSWTTLTVVVPSSTPAPTTPPGSPTG